MGGQGRHRKLCLTAGLVGACSLPGAKKELLIWLELNQKNLNTHGVSIADLAKQTKTSVCDIYNIVPVELRGVQLRLQASTQPPLNR